MSLDFIPAHLEQIPGMLMADAALALDRQSHSWSSLELHYCIRNLQTPWNGSLEKETPFLQAQLVSGA